MSAVVTAKVLLTGAAGQLGQAIQQRRPHAAQLVAHDRNTLDITDAAAVARVMAATQPDVVINAAAYTAVDKAERDPDGAFRVNADGALHVARAAATHGARIIQISTDFVFDGDSHRPYRPEDRCSPVNAYGASKRAGELAALDHGLSPLIIRTSWLYSAAGMNFVTTMLRLFRRQLPVRVVNDQAGSPTWAASLADVIWAAVARPGATGVMHWADAGAATWHALAEQLLTDAVDLGIVPVGSTVEAVTTEEYGSPTPRPRYSVLDTSATADTLGCSPAPWRTNLRTMLEASCAGL